MADSADDIRWMRSALSLSKRGLGRVWPNPSVGCIIVKHGVVLGRGVTAAGGRPHAEAAALAQAGAVAYGATVYVTLEPCAIPGRDQSCADKLVAAGVARVVAAVVDPNPQVNGQGLAKLRGAGIATDCGVLEDEARQANEGFFLRITKSRPMLTLKLATSLDGKIATESGESRWITGPEARRHVHFMRANHDAILTGIGTALADDPTLNVRDIGLSANPVRVVLDAKLALHLSSKLVQTAGQQPLWILHGPLLDATNLTALKNAGANLFECPLDQDGRLNLHGAMKILAEQGLTRVLCESGAKLAAALIRNDLVDRLALFTAGIAIGADGLSALGLLGLGNLAAFPKFRLIETHKIGPDTLSHWHRSAAHF